MTHPSHSKAVKSGTIGHDEFIRLVAALGAQGQDDIAWSENITPPADADDFASEAIFVICNSGMKNTIAVKIFAKVMAAIRGGISAFAVFGHPGKAKAIDVIWRDREALLAGYMAAPDKIEFCASLPWIGGITKYHLAKNFGADVAKPDVHLQRLADREGVTAQALCERLAAATGYRTATVDVLLWRACANGILDSRTGVLAHPPYEGKP
ncbi:hypothetical protein FJ981_27845 [Mesorhizobium sp. B1-1-4]|uniref:hypothetical protein n=1 Tax=Mesorhizobium sp. B1-1-4 TaxID=2589980 RepID=UPI001127C15B|nr:hypothetical protein [Mesorhizobium sp. B1-1-4]TPN44413.1 hypothetical protein FJ981_27845 [Mesorhizobium sp. B1-1-4]